MKAFLLLLTCIPVILLNAQTLDANSCFQFRYVGYSTGTYVVAVENKQAADAFINIDWKNGGSSDTTVKVDAGTVSYFALTGAYELNHHIRMTGTGSNAGCSGGWLNVQATALSPLPTGASLSAQRQLYDVRLKINTEMSVYDRIVLQRSTDGLTFKDVDAVTSVSEYLDAKPNVGVNIYRLALYKDWQTRYSNLVKVIYDTKPLQLSVFTFSGQYLQSITASNREDLHSQFGIRHGLYVVNQSGLTFKTFL